MAIKLVLVLSLIFFLCCVVAAPAGEYQATNHVALTGDPAAKTCSGFLVGGMVEELSGCTGGSERAIPFRYLFYAPDVVAIPQRSATPITNLFVANGDFLRATPQ